jgi:hypothetical protein
MKKKSVNSFEWKKNLSILLNVGDWPEKLASLSCT